MPNVRLRDLIVTFNDDGTVLIKSTSHGLGVKAPPFAVGVLALCSRPTPASEVARAMGPVAERVYAQLVDAGLLVDPQTAADTPTVFHNYAGVEVHRRMLADEGRIRAYREAIQAVVRPGDVVIDAGSGSGVLATLAALAGAGRVYAIERSDMADVIPQVAADSGVGDRVEVVRGDFSEVQLPEKARVLITETFGHLAIGEGMMHEVGACAQRNLIEGGVVIPQAVSLHVAPLLNPPQDLLGPFRKREDGVDLSCLRADASGRGHDRPIRPADIGPVIDVGRWAMPMPTELTARFTLDRPCEGLAAWFTLHVAPGITLPTGPADPYTHWEQTLLPVTLDAGEVELRTWSAPEDRRTTVFSFNGQEVRVR
ncbi:MAG: 50S ribosomal protein L11 methyltransferase [Alphaproteobacteria bacterium]|nr:50S ribosomal protein L11 methyltransferase [Alphaproteobacteria bacterium]